MAYKTGVFEASVDYVRGPCPAGMAVGNRFTFRISPVPVAAQGSRGADRGPNAGPSIQLLPGGGHAPCPSLLTAVDACLYRIIVGFSGPLSCLAGRRPSARPGDGSDGARCAAAVTASAPCPPDSLVAFSVSRVTDAARGRKFQGFPRKPKGTRRITKAVRDKGTE